MIPTLVEFISKIQQSVQICIKFHLIKLTKSVYID